MKQKVLSPGVQDGREAELRAEVLGVLRDGEQRAGRGREQDDEEALLIAQR